MNRYAMPAALLSLALLIAPTWASEPSKAGRKIAKEPEYQSRPKYCLLDFGGETQHRVWLVHDGKTLYVDRNANGDLTEPDERVAAIDEDIGSTSFELGELRIGTRVHKNFSIAVVPFERLMYRDAEAKVRFKADPEARNYRLWIDLELPGYVGQGIGGRVTHNVSRDASGFLEFADSAAEAPLIRFEGLREITLWGQPELTVGRPTEVFLAVGTAGIGPGTTAYVGYEGVVPAGLCPRVEITFASQKEDQPPVRRRYEVRHRCCTVNFHDEIGVPQAAAAGKATIAVSFDAWGDGQVVPTEHELVISAPPPGPEREPVSSRLKQTLVHPNHKGTLSVIAFSPDGERIVAGDYPGGVIQFWDVASGRELTKIDAGSGGRSNSEYFFITRDWTALFAARMGETERTIFEKDDKKLARWEFHGDVRCWDTSTGELRQTFQHSPARGISWLELAPDGSAFLSFDQLSGETEGHPATATSLWNVETGEHIDLVGRRLLPVGAFSPDSRTVAVQEQDGRRVVTAVKLFDVPGGQEKLSIPITDPGAQRIGWMHFSPDGQRLVGQVRDETKNGRHWLKFWDPATGREVASVEGEQDAYFMWMAFSSDASSLAVTSGSSDSGGKLTVFDVASGSERYSIEFDAHVLVGQPAFSADGGWFAVATQVVPETRDRDLGPYGVAQAHIHLFEATTGRARETIISPPGFLSALCFSPDGQTLASGGDGRVLLWDLANPPVGASDDAAP